jgi:uncharacterized glyoxalase superfamily protein PhnB
MTVRSAIIPTLRYEDAPAAIDFLCAAFGFERRAVHADPEDPRTIHHAQLALDGNMIMLSSVRESPYASAAPMLTARQAGGCTMASYIVLEDVDGHAAQAKAAGADIFMPPEDQDYGGRVYSCRDPERNVWSFGSYDPWAKGSG